MASRRPIVPMPSACSKVTALCLFAVWALTLLGPLGFGAAAAHNHEPGQASRECLACALLYSPLLQPAESAPTFAPALIGTASPATPIAPSVPVPYSPAAPRAPPTTAFS